ncbi:MAG TPA: carboxylating nicotinate-nucleotide diphosphorylase [Gemmataceae bacterium]|jgi:nicotinate-nucleotide pyrophosphorylase (carboxylating)|nr:carboxylating nicotinate-nucleotide diphosphorylase [Gemmataceae bacterium]
MPFSPEETVACRRLVALALEEDLGSAGDLTSQAVIPRDLKARTVFVARSPGVLAGLPAVALVLEAVDAELRLETHHEEGSRVAAGAAIATLSGPMRAILAAERTALNFLQHLSGIATLTRCYVDAVAGLPCKILDTRKTIPGWRLLAKYAVRLGGGHNHRLGLHDGILIKDNHLSALHKGVAAIAEAVAASLAYSAQRVWVEVEVENLAQLECAFACNPAMVLLDNMDVPALSQAVQLRNLRAPGILLEASGGVNLQTVRAIAETGVDRVSVGALTHSAPAMDIALDYSFGTGDCHTP